MRKSLSRAGAVRQGFLVAVLGMAVLAVGTGIEANQPSSGRVLAIGDIHGEYDGFVAILRKIGVIDQENNWIGRTTTLVQTGDIVDRGPHVRKVLDLLMKLERQAEEQGGRVVVLLGNHEAMTLMQDYQDATPEIFAAFATEKSEEVRLEAQEEWTTWLREMAKSRGGKVKELSDEKIDQWMETHPPGLIEYQEALGLHGPYGSWLMERPVMFQVGDVIFQHAGISPQYSKMSIAEINDLHRNGIRTYLEDREKLAELGAVPSFFDLYAANTALVYQTENPPIRSFRSSETKQIIAKASVDLNSIQRILLAASPLWFRGFSSLSDRDLRKLLDKLEKTHEARHFVVAHTPVGNGLISERLRGGVFFIDTGMLKSYYGGQPSALEIKDGKFTALYVSGHQVLLDSSPDVVPATAARSESARWSLPVALAVSHGDANAPRLVSDMSGSAPEYVWLGPDDQPLPFQDHESVVDFLRNASIVSVKFIGEGVTKPKKLLLEMNGVRAKAAFRYVSKKGERELMADGTVERYFRDDYRNEVAAYELGRLLGINNVPPAVLREVEGESGSVQLWAEGTTDLKTYRRDNPAFPYPTMLSMYLRRQVHDMNVFDNLIRNFDRNQGNIHWDSQYNLWLIDHTRAFTRDENLFNPDNVKKCSRTLWAALLDLDDKEAREILSPYIGSFEATALVKRRKKLIKLIQNKIDKEGEEKVLFNYGDPPPSMKITYDESTAAL